MRPSCVPALIVCGRRGERLGAAVAQAVPALAGRPLLRHCAERLALHPRIDAVRVVLGAGQTDRYERATTGLELLPPVEGGATRQDSVRLGLESLAEVGPELVLIHDAARPLLSAALVDRVLDALETAEAALPVLPVTDTLKRNEPGGLASSGPDRATLARAQTPQGFRFAAVLQAHRAAHAAGTSYTDDAAVAEAAGLAVACVPGEERNLKVTVPDDLALAGLLLAGAPRAYRTGLGFDVHAFADGRPMILCGVEIPHGQGLLGHSDADAALHAVTDAVLGTIAAGDIGEHFPPSDPRWRNADSALFLEHAVGLLAERGGRIENADLVIVCERPKIGPHRAAMTERLAALLGVPPDRVGVKATTSEGMGFTGRGEGLAAQAVVTASFPAESTA
jgi:2-C-methyl-D-erythritol 4-phosphate cytidylyltransferase/2-C-methyl-D-erythritol 2,4-cyclodiphosphate synthase